MAASCLIKLRWHLSPILQPDQDNTANKPHSVCEWLGCHPLLQAYIPREYFMDKKCQNKYKNIKT